MAETKEPQPIVAVGGVVYRLFPPHQIEILLIKKRHGFWTLPKGRIKTGEQEEDALQREIEEETGLHGQVQSLICQISYEIVKSGKPRQKVVTYYLLIAEDGELRPGVKEQIEKVEWFPIASALRRIHRGKIRNVVRYAANLLAEG